MPELPEVETVKRGLERTVFGKTFATVEVRAKKLFSADLSLIDRVLTGSKVVSLERRAKVLLIGLSSNWTLAIHLKMTGQLVVISPNIEGFVGGHPEKVYETDLPNKHTQVIFSFTDGTTLYFNDLRKFGWARLFPHKVTAYPSEQSLTQFLETLNLGPEPLSDDFTVDYLAKLVAKRTISIKQLLLEQKGISGIGNIYADEALFAAGIRPRRTANSLLSTEVRKLHKTIRDVLKKGIEFGGTSKNTYRNVEGTKGEMQKYLMVYGREDLPCKVCGSPVTRIKIGQRSSHFCIKCQK